MQGFNLSFIKIGFIFLGVMVHISAIAQKPSWIEVLPKPSNNTFYYRVTKAEAKNYEEAYTKAFAFAILESSWKLGVAVNTTDDLEVIESNIQESVKLLPKSMNLPMNKVCEYEEAAVRSMNRRLYVLWQVAAYGNVAPIFDDFTDCR